MEEKNIPINPYFEKYERVSAAYRGDWYHVYRLPGDVYAINEFRHIQEVNFFLIPGKEKAVLFDTGLGILPLKPLIQELYDGEIIAVNSHAHFDHMGNNPAFQPVFGHGDGYAAGVAARGLCRADVGDQMDEEMFKGGYPEGFDPDEYGVKPYEVRNVPEGHIFDLGGRRLRVIYTPGHSTDGLMLYDEENRILFTGDTFYMGALYAQFSEGLFGHSDIKQYYESLERVSREIPSDVQLYCSHGDFIAPSVMLSRAAELLRSVDAGESTEDELLGEGYQYSEKDAVLRRRMGDGISVIYAAKA